MDGRAIIFRFFVSIPAFQLKHPAAIFWFWWFVFMADFLWYIYGESHTITKQILKEHKEITYDEENRDSFSQRVIKLLIHTGKSNILYPYEEITHFLYFKKLAADTPYDGIQHIDTKTCVQQQTMIIAFYMHIIITSTIARNDKNFTVTCIYMLGRRKNDK